MSIEQQVLDRAKESVTNFATKFKREATKKAEDAETALDSKAFNGKSPAQFLTDITALLTSHAANKANPHGDTAESIGSMSYAGYDAYAAGYLDQGVLPISCLGTPDYLPLGVSGSYEGATTVKSTADLPTNRREFYQICLEGDGTAVLLRNATNGSVLGVYYGYITDAANRLDANSRVVLTNQTYRPAVAGNDRVAYLYQGGAKAIAGRLQDNNGVLGRCFICLTQGTFEASRHLGVLLDSAVWDDILNLAEVVVTKSQVLIIHNPKAAPSGMSRSDPIDFVVYTIPIAQFGTNALVTPSQIQFTGGSIGFNGVMYGETNIRMAAIAESATPNPQAMVVHDNGGNLFTGGRQISGSGRVMTFSAPNPANDNEIRVLCAMCCRWSAPGKHNQDVWSGFSFVITLGASPKAVMDETCESGLLSLAADGTVAFSGNLFTGGLATVLLGAGITDHSVRAVWTDSGLIFSSQIPYGTNSPEMVYRGKYNSFANVFAGLKYPLAAPETRYRLSVPLVFGSAAGDQFDGLRLLPGGVLAVYGRSSGSSYSMIRARFKGNAAPWTTNYLYKSVEYGQMDGFAPTTERQAITDAALMNNYRNQVIELDDQTVATYGSVLTTLNNQYSRYITMDANGAVSGSISVTQAQLETLRDQLLAMSPNADKGLTGVCHIELVIPQNPALGAFAVLSRFGANSYRYMTLFSVGVSARSGAIATLTPGVLLGESTLALPAAIGATYANDSLRQSAHWIYDNGDHYLIVGHSGAMYVYPGGSQYGSYRFAVRKEDNQVLNVAFWAQTTNIVAQRYAAFPGIGVVAVNTIDYGTKIAVRKVAKTIAEFAAWNINLTPQAQAKVLLSQEVAQGWQVYFTEETPCMFAGREYILEPTSIDLSTKFTSYANKTFYVYARLIDGVPTWTIEDHPIPESATVIYAGTVVTGTTSISSINVDKVTRLGVYRVSTQAVGSAIPVSSGSPEAAGKLIW